MIQRVKKTKRIQGLSKFFGVCGYGRAGVYVHMDITCVNATLFFVTAIHRTPEDENTSLSPKDSASEIDPTALPTMSNSIHSVLTSASESLSLKSKQAVEWSRLLFKCIKPVGEPEFRLNGDIGELYRYIASKLWSCSILTCGPSVAVLDAPPSVYVVFVCNFSRCSFNH